MRIGSSAWHALSGVDVLSRLASGADGLSANEAARRLAQHGPNTMPAAKRRSLFAILLRQFASPLIYILFLAAVIAFTVGKSSDAVVILVEVSLNALIGALQESRAERSMYALRKLAGLRAGVIRAGVGLSVEARELVIGDVLLLGAGDAVGADARLLHCAALAADEATLTGESLPVTKHRDALSATTLLAERANMVFAGTHIAAGRGRAVVVATGLDTEVGRIATLTEQAVEPKTPLEVRIATFGHWLAGTAALLFVTILAFGVGRGLAFTEILMVAISQMVSLVPEGLPAAMTIALAVGMQRMAAHGAIVRRLAAVETLGSITVICSDKTGTLTRNEITVTTAWLPGGRSLEVTGAGYAPQGRILARELEITAADDNDLRALLEAAALCNDAQLVPPDDTDPRWRPLGDPTEAALLTFALKGCVNLPTLRREQPRQAEIPFDAATKMMATQHGHGPRGRVCIKGAPEAVAALCTNVPHACDAMAGDMAARALRVLAVAEVPDGAVDDAVGFAQFAGRAIFLGLIGQMDPPRDEVRVAIAECRSAGIRPVTVTGDHKATGLAVAQALGIARDGDLAVDGGELERMTERELRLNLDRITVFARVHPAQKLRIVEAFQSQKHVVAMTGDGVNDAPALARADVGVAMGITGTEVAKGAAKIIIAAGYADKPQFFVDKLAQGVAMIAAAFYPKDVILRLSDFKTNEYANIIGGKQFEPAEENPMIGFRGASRYYHPRYRTGFALECRAVNAVRNVMGLTNVKLMIPFCRTVDEGRKVQAEMEKHGLKRGQDGLELYVMCEVPSNVILAKEFGEIFDGFSIGSNDLTQLILGVDRDSEIVAPLFDERNAAVKTMIAQVIRTCREHGRKIGICGQAPSDYPEFAQFLVEQGIDSISLTPDTVLKTTRAIATKEQELGIRGNTR